ncbi:hypothetical protein F53441_9665 [Fusarium austroafricanum]|uniref:Uncharacterized protein n=1 Tax=Fusarium austroafricanum TaxID=2364996 RepID=A0A8H4NW63_9HYPO|nr:hypothetical protein F53441_9665 [Fusarium austroafricanum]
MVRPYFDLITSNRQYGQYAKVIKPLGVLNLNPSSEWGRDHLFACHVVVSTTGKPLLPALEYFKSTGAKSKDDQKRLKEFVDGVKKEEQTLLVHKLVDKVGTTLGQIWAALEDVQPQSSEKNILENAQQDGDSPKSHRPKRRRYSVVNRNFVPSGEQTFGSSPPGSQDSSSSQSNTSNYAPQLPYIIEHILYCIEFTGSEDMVQFRLPERATFPIANKDDQNKDDQNKDDQNKDDQNKDKPVIAIDDGGLCVRIAANKDRKMKFVVLLEAKRQMTVYEDKYVVSDNVLGQMTCEAIAARSSGASEHSGDKVFVINATQDHMCFFEFTITDKTLNKIKTGDTPEDALEVSATEWFDLKRDEDRERVKDNIYWLIKYLWYLWNESLGSAL